MEERTMYRKFISKTLAVILSAAMLTVSAAAAKVEVNGTILMAEEGWVEDGVSYITLDALSREGGYLLTWNDQKLTLSGQGAELTVQPGALYIEVNGRVLYVPGGVRTVDGETALPLRLLENALGANVEWDGEERIASLDTQDAQPKNADYGEEDLYWLSRIISAESRGEPLLGQLAVGNVVLNRVADTQFPNTIKSVIFDQKNGVQFEPTENGTVYLEPTANSLMAAKMVLEGADVVGDCLYFFAPALSKGTWIVNNRTYHTTIGCHRFYF